MVLGNSFKLRPNSRALGLAGSVMTVVLAINGCSHSYLAFIVWGRSPEWPKATSLLGGSGGAMNEMNRR